MSVDGAGFTEHPPTPASASERAHQRQELATAESVGPDRGLLGKLPPHHFLEGFAAGQFLQAAPILPARGSPCAALDGGQFSVKVFSAVHRWQVVQLVRLSVSFTSYCLTSLRPNSN